MDALMDAHQYHSHSRGSEPLNGNNTNINNSSKLLSPQTNLLYNTNPSLYTTYNKLNIDTNEFERLQKLANSFNNVVNSATVSDSNNGRNVNNNEIGQSPSYPIELDNLIISSNIVKRFPVIAPNPVNPIKLTQIQQIKSVTPIKLTQIQQIKSVNPITSNQIQNTNVAQINSDITQTQLSDVNNSKPNTSINPSLRNLIRAVSDNNINNEYTHVTLYDPHARWTIPDENMFSFWTGYCDLIDQEEENLCIAERPKQIMPLISKFTFKFNCDSELLEFSTIKDSPEFIKVVQWTCHIYQIVISECFNISDSQIELAVVVLESTNCWYIQDVESGQHFMIYEIKLQFPYAHIDAGMQNRIIRPRVIQLLRNNNVSSLIKVRPLNDWEQIISTGLLDYPITMYGSNERPSKPTLELKHIWGNITSQMLMDDIQPDEITLEDAFVPKITFMYNNT
jgi:hypothetical protein